MRERGREREKRKGERGKGRQKRKWLFKKEDREKHHRHVQCIWLMQYLKVLLLKQALAKPYWTKVTRGNIKNRVASNQRWFYISSSKIVIWLKK